MSKGRKQELKKLKKEIENLNKILETKLNPESKDFDLALEKHLLDIQTSRLFIKEGLDINPKQITIK